MLGGYSRSYRAVDLKNFKMMQLRLKYDMHYPSHMLGHLAKHCT